MERISTNRPAQPHPPPMLSVGDVYYVLFRHKWKIIVLSLAGFVAAACVHFFQPPLFESEAEVLVQYVPQAGGMPVVGNDQAVVRPGSGGMDVLYSEIQILTSLDLAEEAVSNLGPASILAKIGGGNDAIRAASYVHGKLDAEPWGGGVIMVVFRHPDPQVVQPVLGELITDFIRKNNDINTPGQYDDALTKEKDALTGQLQATENQIATLKNSAGILSLDDARRNLADAIAKDQEAMEDARAELVGIDAAIKEGTGSSPANPAPTNAAPAVPSDEVQAYNDICSELGMWRKKEMDYEMQGFTRSNALVEEVVGHIDSGEKSKADLEKKYPQIAGLATVSTVSGGSGASPVTDLRAELGESAAIQAKLKEWEQKLGELQMQATNLNNLEPLMAQYEQEAAIEQANLQTLSEALMRSHIENALKPYSAPNIKWVQNPTPPTQDWKTTQKLVVKLAIGGILAGLALAFFFEFVLDRSIRRPVEIEAKLKVPLFLSIPDINRNGHSRLARSAARRQLPLDAGAKEEAPAANGDAPHESNDALQVVSLERNAALHPFYDALRDRLIVYFEVKNLTHKPKLVAVTSAGPGAGVSTIAAGLAASLSETGDGNVLLVDMNLEQGAAQQFYKGKAGCGLDAALKMETKADALVQENLYVVNGNTNSDEFSRILPKRFSALVPKLKTSDYDYIIFDMPPVNQTSLTSRLARFMDMVLLVVESEKSNREVVQQANTWLTESGATVGAVLNKTRQYVPQRLHQEFLSDK